VPPYDGDTTLPTTDFRLQDPFHGMKRHQLYDAPVPRNDRTSNSSINSNLSPSPSGKRATIKFDTQDVVHKYDVPGTGEKHTTERRVAAGSPSVGYPPLPSVPPPMDGLPPSSSHRNIDLLGIAEDPVEESSNTKDNSRHSLEIPVSRIKRDNEVQSAPPTVSQRFAAMMSGTPHTPFSKPPSTMSLLSFPSVTDSGPSENWEEDMEGHERRQKEWEVERETMKEQNQGREGREKGKERSKEKSKERDRPRVGKRYPGASEDDDLEESISLWDRGGVDDDLIQGVSPPEYKPGGIRLVQPKRPDMI